MLHYRFKALNAEGVMLDGRIAAQSEREAARLLERRGLSLVDISEEGAGSPAAVSGPAFLRGRERKLRHQDIILALHELSTLLASGVGLAESVAAQKRIEAADSMPFEIYRREYVSPRRLGRGKGAVMEGAESV